MLEFQVTAPALDRYIAAYEHGSDVMQAALASGMQAAAEQLRSDTVTTTKEMGLVTTGELQRSWFPEVRFGKREIEGMAYTNLEYAGPLNEGAKPHTAPLSALKRWAHLKFGDESIGVRVWQRIRRVGMQGKHYVQYAIERNRGKTVKILDSYLEAALRKWGH